MVLGTITHLNGFVLEMRLEGEEKPLEPTTLHPLFSLTRGNWVQAGKLRVGEVLKTREGAVRIEGIRQKPGVHRVYNLEVEGEHWYFASRKCVLSHNTCPTKINQTKKGLEHVTDRHTTGGAQSAGKSVFSQGEDISKLVEAAEGVAPKPQSGGNFERIVDAGRPIGIDRATNQATSTYTVITTPAGDLVTAFPGVPGPR